MMEMEKPKKLVLPTAGNTTPKQGRKIDIQPKVDKNIDGCYACGGSHRLWDCDKTTKKQKQMLYKKHRQAMVKNSRKEGSKMMKDLDRVRNQYITNKEQESKVKYGSQKSPPPDDNKKEPLNMTPWEFLYPADTLEDWEGIKNDFFGRETTVYKEETLPLGIVLILAPRVTLLKTKLTWMSYQHIIQNDPDIIEWLYASSVQYDRKYIKLQRFYYSNAHLMEKAIEPSHVIGYQKKKVDAIKDNFDTVQTYSLSMFFIKYMLAVAVILIILLGLIWNQTIYYLNPFFFLLDIISAPIELIFIFIMSFIPKVYGIQISWWQTFSAKWMYKLSSFFSGCNIIKKMIYYVVTNQSEMLKKNFFEMFEFDQAVYLNSYLQITSNIVFLAVQCIICIAALILLKMMTQKFYNRCMHVLRRRVGFNYRNNRRRYTLITTFPRFSLWLEELIKCIPYGWKFIGTLEYFKYGNWTNYHWHKRSMKFGLINRIAHHRNANKKLALNIPKQNTSLYQEYVESISIPTKNFSKKHEKCIEVLPCQTLPTLPKTLRHIVNYGNIHNPKYKQDFSGYSGTTPLLFCISRFQKVADSYDNRKASYHTRYITENKTIEWTVLEECSKILDTIYDVPCDKTEYSDEEWFSSLKPSQKSAVLRDREKYGDGHEFNKVEMAAKSDEMLVCPDFDDENGKFAPRGLFNLTGYWLDILGVWVQEATNDLKKMFPLPHLNNNPIYYKGMYYYPYFACGATSDELQQFYNYAEENISEYECYFVVMGDDNAMPDLENDFSKYDRTQSFILFEILAQKWKHFGYNPTVIEEWLRLCNLPAINYHKKTGKKIPLGKYMEGKFTGEPTTCLSNSIFNIMATIYSYSKGRRNDKKLDLIKYEKAFTDIGFMPKIIQNKYTTFLKGVFLPNVVGTWTWIRLPSFLGKFGKVLKDIDICVPKEYRKKSIEKKTAFVLWSMWLGYGEMSTNYMYDRIGLHIKRLCKKYLAILPGTPMDITWFVKSVKPIEVSDTIFNDFLQSRYGINNDEMVEMLEFFETVDDLPSIYHHPLINKLIDSDY